MTPAPDKINTSSATECHGISFVILKNNHFKGIVFKYSLVKYPLKKYRIAPLFLV